MLTENTIKDVLALLERSQKILVLPSSPLDGDSIGSAIAFYSVLKKLGKEVTVVCSDPIPNVFQFLPSVSFVGDRLVNATDFIITIDLKNASVEQVQSMIEDNKVNIVLTPKSGKFSEEDVSFKQGKTHYDLIITVDTAELKQLRSVYENNVELFTQIPILNIDHHVSNDNFGKVNCVDVMASSTTEMLVEIIDNLEKKYNQDLFDEDIATLLLTGIITDTGSFQNANTTPGAFDVAANLVAYGARQQEIIRNIYKTKQLSQLKLWGRVLTKIQTDETHKIVWSTVTQQDFKDTGSTDEQTGDIIDELMSNAPGAEFIVLIKEKADGSIAGSIRSTTSFLDASAIAKKWGGGGHTQAAGFRVKNLPLRDVEYGLINDLKASRAQESNPALLEVVEAGEAKTVEEAPVVEAGKVETVEAQVVATQEAEAVAVAPVVEAGEINNGVSPETVKEPDFGAQVLEKSGSEVVDQYDAVDMVSVQSEEFLPAQTQVKDAGDDAERQVIKEEMSAEKTEPKGSLVIDDPFANLAKEASEEMLTNNPKPGASAPVPGGNQTAETPKTEKKMNLQVPKYGFEDTDEKSDEIENSGEDDKPTPTYKFG